MPEDEKKTQHIPHVRIHIQIKQKPDARKVREHFYIWWGWDYQYIVNIVFEQRPYFFRISVHMLHAGQQARWQPRRRLRTRAKTQPFMRSSIHNNYTHTHCTILVVFFRRFSTTVDPSEAFTFWKCGICGWLRWWLLSVWCCVPWVTYESDAHTTIAHSRPNELAAIYIWGAILTHASTAFYLKHYRTYSW